MRPFCQTTGVGLLALLLAGCGSPPLPRLYDSLNLGLPQFRDSGEVGVELCDGAVAGGRIVAVGEGGTVWQSDDSAQSWQRVDTPVGSTLTGISFAPDGRRGWAVGRNSVILTTTDGGDTWQKQWLGPDPARWLLDVIALDARHVIAIGVDGLCLETTDAGLTWRQRRPINTDLRLNRISRGPTGTLYIAGEHGLILRSTDAGISWDQLASPESKSLYGVLPLGPHTLLAYGASMAGRVYRSADDGAHWTATTIAPHQIFATALRLRDGAILLAANTVYVSHDEGRTFAPWSGHPGMNPIELLQAPDGAIVVFGPSHASTLTRP